MNTNANKEKENRGFQPSKNHDQFGYQPKKKVESEKHENTANSSKTLVPPKGTKGDDA